MGVIVRVEDVTPFTDKRVYNARPQGEHSLWGGAIVLHHTAGRDSVRYLQTYREDQNGKNVSVSTHKVFAKDGTIWKIVPEWARAWHAGDSEWGGRMDWNDFSLGYEIENLGDGVDPYTDEQYEAVAQSLAYDTALFHIADRWVRDHREIATPRGRKTDPVGLDEGRLWRRVMAIRAQWPAEWPVERWYASE